MEFIDSKIKGCFQIKADIYRDNRGAFVRTFQEELYAKKGIQMRLGEQYFSISKKSVIRGMHFQIPPFGQDKLVTAVVGRVFDAVIDLRVGSETYGQYDSFELDAEKGDLLFIPEGLAHGFQALSETATLYYQVSKIWSKDHDTGVRWDSAGIPWPIKDAIMADKDKTLTTVKDYRSPFKC